MSTAPAGEIAVRRDDAERMGFFTDTTVCIGCKACEVACKQWNDLPADGAEFRKGGSYDHTGELSASTWRHVHFVETTAFDGGHLPSLPAAQEEEPSLVEVAEGRASSAAGSEGMCPPAGSSSSTKRTCRHVLADSSAVWS